MLCLSTSALSALTDTDQFSVRLPLPTFHLSEVHSSTTQSIPGLLSEIFFCLLNIHDFVHVGSSEIPKCLLTVFHGNIDPLMKIVKINLLSYSLYTFLFQYSVSDSWFIHSCLKPLCEFQELFLHLPTSSLFFVFFSSFPCYHWKTSNTTTKQA